MDKDPDHIRPYLETIREEEDYEELPLFKDQLKTTRVGKKLELPRRKTLSIAYGGNGMSLHGPSQI